MHCFIIRRQLCSLSLSLCIQLGNRSRFSRGLVSNFFFLFWKFKFWCHFWITQKNFMLRIMLFFVIVEMGHLRILWVFLLWSNLITSAQFLYHFWISQKNYAQNCVVLCNCGTGSPQNLVGFASLINLLLLLIWLLALTWLDHGILFRTTFFFSLFGYCYCYY